MHRAFVLFLLYFGTVFSYVPHPPDRGPSDPFITGDTFRYFCDFAYDEIGTFDPYSITNGSTIFVKIDLLEKFFREVHPLIPVAYILVSHNSDYSVPGPFAYYLDDGRLIAWFTQNLDATVHPKLHPIPIGIANRRWKLENKEALEAARAKNFDKAYLVYSNFHARSFPSERDPLYKQFLQAPYAYTYTLPEFKPYAVYAEDLAKSKFVLTPRGNGLDTHRIWEALYAGAYPIVKTSTLDLLYEDLPVVIVYKWTDVTEEFLNQKYEELKGKTYRMEKLSMEYWLKQIDECRKKAMTPKTD